MTQTGCIDQDLAHIDLFRGLSKHQLRDLSCVATRMLFEPGRSLTRKGKPGSELIIVLEGEVEVRDGDRVLGTRGPGTHLGEIAMLGVRLQTATVVTTTPVAAAIISKPDFLALVEAVPGLAEELRATMDQRLAELR